MKMKKNRFLKTAGALLILCLLTTCVIGTTFAKYTTGGSATDTARVAKWGVQLQMQSNTMFTNQYSSTGSAITVKSVDDASIVAPGTSTDVTSPNTVATFAIKGQPEVAVDINITLTGNDIYLAAGTYDNETTATDTADEFTLADNYYPVKFTLWQTADWTGPITPVAIPGATGVTIAELSTWFANWSADPAKSSYNPNTILDSTYEITWEWVYEENDDFNAADTFLGNRAADNTPGTWNLVVDYAITIEVVQID